MKIIPARPENAKLLTDLTKQSKAIWGYNKELMNQWENELAITKEYISSNIVRNLVSKNNIIGYYSLIKTSKETIYLDNLFIHPSLLNKGHGKNLLNDAIQWSREHHYGSIDLHSDPNAEHFYTKNGFTIIGKKQSSILGRYLPHMELKL